MDIANKIGIYRRACGLILAVGAVASILAVPASASVVAERRLAGVEIFAPMSRVLKMFGTPSEVRVGSTSTGTTGANGQTGGFGGGSPFGGGGGGFPGAGGGGFPGGAMGGGYPGQGDRGDDTDSDSGSGLPGFGGGFPGAAGGGGYPGAGGFPGAGGEGGTTDANTGLVIQRNMVTWIYDLPNMCSLEFTFSNDGRVVQIHATGLKSDVRTQRGVALGTKMSDVFDHYGFPERQMITGRILNAIYIDKYHIAFQFYHQRLCGIIVAAVD